MHASFSEILGATKIYQDGHKFAKSERKIYKKRKFDLMVAFITQVCSPSKKRRKKETEAEVDLAEK